MKYLFLSSILVFCFQVGAAGTEVGNGGVGVLSNGKIQMFDLFESGRSYYSPQTYNLEVFRSAQKAVEEALSPRSYPTALIARKVAHLAMQFPITAAIVEGTIKLLKWDIIPAQLTRLESDFLSPISLKDLELVQIANRSYNSVLISSSAWQKMDDEQRAALVFHEVFYSLLLSQDPHRTDSRTAELNMRSRFINSFILGEDLATNPARFKAYIQADLPIIQFDGVMGVRLRSMGAYQEILYAPVFTLSTFEKVWTWDLTADGPDLNEVCRSTGPIQISLYARSILLSVEITQPQSSVLLGYFGSSPVWEVRSTDKKRDCRMWLEKAISEDSRLWFQL